MTSLKASLPCDKLLQMLGQSTARTSAFYVDLAKKVSDENAIYGSCNLQCNFIPFKFFRRHFSLFLANKSDKK
jgi:hypothetical protein